MMQMKLKAIGLWAALINLSALTVVGCHETSAPTTPVCSATYGPLRLNGSEQVVYDYDIDQCAAQDYADNPVRPFLVGPLVSATVKWFASNAFGYYDSQGVPVGPGVSDILAKIARVRVSGSCVRWLSSRINGQPAPSDTYPVESYYNEVWMVVPYTTDGQDIYALIHNEYHTVPTESTNIYGNLVGASSSDGANTFNFYQVDAPADSNTPVIVAPYPYNPSEGIGGMFAQSNIIKWGAYYYMLVDQDLQTIDSSAPQQGVCIYRTNDLTSTGFRTWVGWNARNGQYDIPLVQSYPTDATDPNLYLCSPVPGLPAYYHFSWSYNVVLHKFIIMGLTAENPNNEAFVYTLGQLNPVTGALTSATNSGVEFQTYTIQPIVSAQAWQQGGVTAQFYPSILDPTSPNLTDSTTPNVELGDRNFQYSGAQPYIYYTRFNPINADNPHGENRDVVREPLRVESCTLSN